MSSLLEGLTSVRETIPVNGHEAEQAAADLPSREKSVPKHSAATPSGPKERICTSVDKTVMNKVRAISEKEGVLINELITLGLDMVIAKYEEAHGQVRPKKMVKGDIDSIFR